MASESDSIAKRVQQENWDNMSRARLVRILQRVYQGSILNEIDKPMEHICEQQDNPLFAKQAPYFKKLVHVYYALNKCIEILQMNISSTSYKVSRDEEFSQEDLDFIPEVTFTYRTEAPK